MVSEATVPFVLLHAAEDAREAVDSGVDGIVVSNHGGRQLDGVPATVGLAPGVPRQLDVFQLFLRERR